MATFWKRAAHSVNHMFSFFFFLYLLVIFRCFPIRFRGREFGSDSKVKSIMKGNGSDCNGTKVDTENVNENSDADIGQFQ